jgi:hypothetical protein
MFAYGESADLAESTLSFCRAGFAGRQKPEESMLTVESGIAAQSERIRMQRGGTCLVPEQRPVIRSSAVLNGFRIAGAVLP